MNSICSVLNNRSYDEIMDLFIFLPPLNSLDKSGKVKGKVQVIPGTPLKDQGLVMWANNVRSRITMVRNRE